MSPKFHLSIFFLFLINTAFGQSYAEDEDKIIHTSDGKTLATKKEFVIQCKKYYGAPADNKMITQICQCQVNLLNRRYSMKQIKSYEQKYKGRGLATLIEEDTSLQNQIKQCLDNSKNLIITSIPAYRQSFITRCKDRLTASIRKPVNDTLATAFCSCAADVLEKRKVTLETFDDLGDPSSFLYNEIAYKCGSPFLEPGDLAKDWKASNSLDVVGDRDVDTVTIISVTGMHKVKIKIGTETRIWMIDSGASDLLISEEYASRLKKQGVINELNFIGEGVYSLADSRQISCKRYKIDSLQIGHFRINNVVLAYSRDTKDFLLGKSLLNKFTEWTIDNKNNKLILRK